MKQPLTLRHLLFALLAGMLAVFSAGVLAADKSPVTVHYKDPQHFTEVRLARMAGVPESDHYLDVIRSFLEKRGARILKPGQHLDITITDIDLAGEYEPWLGPQMSTIRIIRDIYPPRINLDFTLYAADGSVLRKGSRKLIGMGIMDTVSFSDQDPRRYEKALLQRWLRRGPEHL